jgi:hypothetical protein
VGRGIIAGRATLLNTMYRIAVVAWLCACSSPAQRPHLAKPQAPTSQPAPALIVGRSDGVFEVDLDGNTIRRLGHTPAQSVSKISGGRLVTLSDDTVRIVDPARGREDVIGQIPTTVSCVRGGESSTYSVWPRGGVAGATDQRVVLNLVDMDYDGMVDMFATMCLDRGTIYVSDSDSGCMVPGASREPAPCLEPPSDHEPPATHDVAPLVATTIFPYVIEDDRVAHYSAGVRDAVSEPLFGSDDIQMHLASVSPSNRWALLIGPEFTASSLYNLYLLLDRVTGKLYPVSSRIEKWPAPLTDAVLHQTIDPEAGRTPDAWVNYIEQVTWIPAANDDVLRVGSRLIHAGTRVVNLGGEPAL